MLTFWNRNNLNFQQAISYLISSYVIKLLKYDHLNKKADYFKQNVTIFFSKKPAEQRIRSHVQTIFTSRFMVKNPKAFEHEETAT